MRRHAINLIAPMLVAGPASASKDGAGIGEGLAWAFEIGFFILVASLALGIAGGWLVARARKVRMIKAVLLGIACALLVDLIALGGLFVKWNIGIESAAAHERALQPFRDRTRDAFAKAAPGGVRLMFEELMREVPPADRREKGFIAVTDFAEQLQWHPLGWTGADTAAMVEFADAVMPGEVVAANMRGTAIAIEWLNGRTDTSLVCAGQWVAKCADSASSSMSTACSRQRAGAESIALCAPERLREAKERLRAPR